MPVVDLSTSSLETVDAFVLWAKAQCRDLHDKYSAFSFLARQECLIDGRPYRFYESVAEVVQRITALTERISPSRADNTDQKLLDSSIIKTVDDNPQLHSLILYMKACLDEGKPSDEDERLVFKKIYTYVYALLASVKAPASKDLLANIINFETPLSSENHTSLIRFAINCHNMIDFSLITPVLYDNYRDLSMISSLLVFLARKPKTTSIISDLYPFGQFDFQYEYRRAHPELPYAFSYPYIYSLPPEGHQYINCYLEMLTVAMNREDFDLFNFLISRQPINKYFVGYLFEMACKSKSLWAVAQLLHYPAVNKVMMTGTMLHNLCDIAINTGQYDMLYMILPYLNGLTAARVLRTAIEKLSHSQSFTEARLIQHVDFIESLIQKHGKTMQHDHAVGLNEALASFAKLMRGSTTIPAMCFRVLHNLLAEGAKLPRCREFEDMPSQIIADTPLANSPSRPDLRFLMTADGFAFWQEAHAYFSKTTLSVLKQDSAADTLVQSPSLAASSTTASDDDWQKVLYPPEVQVELSAREQTTNQSFRSWLLGSVTYPLLSASPYATPIYSPATQIPVLPAFVTDNSTNNNKRSGESLVTREPIDDSDEAKLVQTDNDDEAKCREAYLASFHFPSVPTGPIESSVSSFKNTSALYGSSSLTASPSKQQEGMRVKL